MSAAVRDIPADTVPQRPRLIRSMNERFEAAAKASTDAWQRASLFQKFAVVSSLILLFGMYLIGQWVSVEVTRSAVQTRAAAAVLYINNFVQPRVQALGSGATLAASDKAALDGLIGQELGEQTLSGFRIWTRQAIAYSDRREMVGRSFKPDSRRDRAWAGEVVADLKSQHAGDLADSTDPDDPLVANPDQLLEIYAPIRETGTNRVIALAETYERVPTLVTEVRRAQIGSWIIIANIGLVMFAWQLSVIHQSSHTIDRQRQQLNERIDDLTTMLTENNELRHINRAAIRAAELNENYLRRVGADLHDGPLQLIGATMFRLDSLDAVIGGAEPAVATEAREDISAIREAIDASLKELRDMAAGFVLPEIEKLSLSDAISIAAQRHERRTDQRVQIDLTDQGGEIAATLKVCLYRVVQEGLTNAFRHGKCAVANIEGHIAPTSIEIIIRDEGPGFEVGTILASGNGLGLFGLRDRIESLGGTFSIVSSSGIGTSLVARFSFVPSQTEVAGI